MRGRDKARPPPDFGRIEKRDWANCHPARSGARLTAASDRPSGGGADLYLLAGRPALSRVARLGTVLGGLLVVAGAYALTFYRIR